jgi:hypothetical protein
VFKSDQINLETPGKLHRVFKSVQIRSILKILESFTINNVVSNVAKECNEILVTVIYGYQFRAFPNFRILLIPVNISRQRVPKRRHIKFRRR